MTAIKHLLARLRRCRSGNAFMIVAAGMPALIGGAGFAVDISQWYMWKSELQYAVDQAALAGAFARANTSTAATYEDRAEQEFGANLHKTAEFASTPSVSLENWATGTDNSVVVTATATKRLPFSSFLTDSAATIRASAQAAFEEGTNYTSCLVAVDPDAEGAITVGGSAEFIAGCGIAALSTSENAITVNGNPTVDAGWLIAAGGIDDWFNTNTNDTVIENQTGLTDPFEDLTPPTNNTPRTGECPKGKTTVTETKSYKADSVSTRTQITYAYYKKNGNNYTANAYTGTYKKANVDSTTSESNVTLSALPASNTVVTGPTVSNYDWVDGSGSNKIYQRSTTTVTKTYVNAREVTDTATTTEAAPTNALVLQPGTYSALDFKCDVVFTSGIYVIDGGMFNVNSQYNQTGSGVMFVLKNGAGIDFNGGANVNLTAMTVAQLEAIGISNAQAVKLAGMLIFEDPNSSGSTKNKINGNASLVLNGTVYLPVSNLDIKGSAGVTSQCLMLVASTITLSGNMSMESFCPAGMTEETEVLSTKDRVRLVS